MLAHVFPGLFVAMTLFMAVDIFSSKIDLASRVISDPNAIVMFVIWLIIGGTILGIIIDGIHHYSSQK